MAYKTFVDAEGVAWQVWEVRPGRVERRSRERRALRRPIEWPDRRSGSERRQTAEVRSLLTPELAGGWLAFHSDTERRRYVPIPGDWASFTAEELERLCREATPVPSLLWPSEEADSRQEARPRPTSTGGSRDRNGGRMANGGGR